MTPERRYPDAPAGPFAEPPRTLTDKEGREIEIRAATEDPERTHEALVEMYDEFDPGDRAQGLPPVRRAKISDWLEMILGTGPDLAAWHGQRAVGHATLVPDDDEHELAIFVHAEYRSAGIGRALLEALLGEAIDRGIERVWLTVERWNTIAVSLYESVGFEQTESGSFEIEMSLQLPVSDG